MNKLYLVIPEKPSATLTKMIEAAVNNSPYVVIENIGNVPDLKSKKILFAIELNEAGYNTNLVKILSKLWNRGKDALYGSTGAVLIHSSSDLYTKTIAQDIVFRCNLLGCRFPGRPIVEATQSLRNFLTMQKAINKSLEEILYICCDKLGKRLINDNPKPLNNPKILVLHASNRNTSNTLMLWDMVYKHLLDLHYSFNIKEIHIENGTVKDCIGCTYRMCKHYGEQSSCFYGGIMVEDIYPAVLEADAIIWICPNYNDSISANMSAVINRLTALFRITKFYNKNIFSVIVSGNSGSDAVAKQLISALNMNKTFRLPPYFAIMATANDPGAIMKVPDIDNKAKTFAENLIKEIKA